MGFNTAILILNDGFDQLEKHPKDFVSGISRSMRGGGSIGVGIHGNPVQVMPTAHADVFRLYGSHGNLMVDLSLGTSQTRELIARRPEVVQGYIDRARNLLDTLEAELRKG